MAEARLQSRNQRLVSTMIDNVPYSVRRSGSSDDANLSLDSPSPRSAFQMGLDLVQTLESGFVGFCRRHF